MFLICKTLCFFTQECFVPAVLEKIFFNFVYVFLIFCNYLPLEKGVVLHLNNLESPSPKDAVCQVWLKLAQWFWRKIYLNFVNIFSLFRNYLPLEQRVALHLNKQARMLCAKFGWFWRIISPWTRTWPFIWTNLIPFIKECFVPSLVEIGLVVLEKKMKMWKVTTTTTTTTDKFWSEKLT